MKKIIKNSKGQGVMEYIIITSLVGILCLSVVKGLGTTMKTRLKNMKSYFAQEIVIPK